MPRLHNRRATLIVAAPLLALLALAPATPAAAHSALRDQNPGDGESVVTAPPTLSLGFNEDLIDAGTTVTVTGADGREWTDGAATVQGSELEQPLSTEVPAGTYSVMWRVVSADGHPIDGTFDFTVTVGVDAPATPTATEAPEPAPEVPDSSTAAPSDGAEPGEGPDTATVALIAATVLLLLVAPLVAFLIIRRRRRD